AQSLVKTDARIYCDIIDVRLEALRAVKLLELAQRLQVIAAHASSIDGQAVVLLHILKFNYPIEGKVDFGLIQNVEEDYLIAAMPQMMQAFQHRLRVGKQVAEQDHQALAADHGRELKIGRASCRERGL